MSPLDSVAVKKIETTSNNSLTFTVKDDIITSARGALIKESERAFVVTLKKLKKTYIFVADE